eukprot:TRINITY_DN45564_c0_g1_i1.p2 TRINITY_DN45564_c0_g1~~TRINITY_DN45564_c0_g1_i1.p2  ORF type:complete len:103 (+),score=4.12 TRINITY_DN45564_c0_g1_i1:112-420(+)
MRAAGPDLLRTKWEFCPRSRTVLHRPANTHRNVLSYAKNKGNPTDAEYYKGLYSSPLSQRYTIEADENNDMDMLSRNIKLAAYPAVFLAVMVALFLYSNGLI